MRVSISAIQANVAASFRIPRGKMTEPINRGLGKDGRNAREYSTPRQVAMYLAAELTPFSLVNIGKHFGGRDHSTVIHAIAAVEKEMAKSADFSRKVVWIRDFIISSASPQYPQVNVLSSAFVPHPERGIMAA